MIDNLLQFALDTYILRIIDEQFKDAILHTNSVIFAYLGYVTQTTYAIWCGNIDIICD